MDCVYMLDMGLHYDKRIVFSNPPPEVRPYNKHSRYLYWFGQYCQDGVCAVL